MKWRTWAVLLALVIWCGVAEAQGTCTAPVGTKCTTAITLPTPNSSSVTNPRVVMLSASPVASTWTVGSATLDAGTSAVVPITLTIIANRSWTVAVSGDPSWRVSANGWSSKPVSHVLWSTTATGTSTALATSGVTVATGVAGSSMVQVLYFRTLLSWTTDTPGTYTMPLSFSVVSP